MDYLAGNVQLVIAIFVSNEVAKVIEPYLCEKLDINNYDYFLSCEEENISYLKE